MIDNIDDILPIVMYCLTRFVGFQRVRDNQSSKINAPGIFCVWKRVQHSHIERRMHLVEHYISPTSTSSITYHVELLHIAYIHVDGVVHTKRSEDLLSDQFAGHFYE